MRSWDELNRSLYAALKLEKLAMFIALSFIALVASFSIIANLIMMVTEKAREVAILKSMGARDGAILRIFFAEGLYIGILGLVLGVVRRRRGLLPAGDQGAAAAGGGLLHREDAGGDARRRDRRRRPGGAGAVLPRHHLPGGPGIPDAARSTGCGTSSRRFFSGPRPSARQPWLTLQSLGVSGLLKR